AFLGRRAIALSQYMRPGGQVDWEWALRECGEIAAALMSRPPIGRMFWNVNLPHLTSGRRRPPVVFCKLDLNPLHVRYRIEDSMSGVPTTAHFIGDYHQRLHE